MTPNGTVASADVAAYYVDGAVFHTGEPVRIVTRRAPVQHGGPARQRFAVEQPYPSPVRRIGMSRYGGEQGGGE